MRSLFQTIADRLRALFVADLALEFEAQLLSPQAGRRGELLVQAEQHDRHGFPGVAEYLRRQAEALSLDRPLSSILPALEHWRSDEPAPTIPTEVDPIAQPQGNGHLPVGRLP